MPVVKAWSRRSLLLLFSAGLPLGCSESARLIKLRSPGTPDQRVRLEVLNNTSVVIVGLYMARTEDVENAKRGHTRWGSESEAETWGNDLLSADLLPDRRAEVPISSPGRWDVRPVDEDGRYQHVAGLKLRPGGRYLLEINDGNWRAFAQ